MARRKLRFDFTLAGRGYLLAKSGTFRGRAWARSSAPDTPVHLQLRSYRDDSSAEYGGVDPQIDYPEVWDDWSGGFGHAIREPDAPNTYHWSDGFDTRFPRQLVHCQAPQTLRDVATGSPTHSTHWALLERVNEISDASLLTRTGPIGCGRLALLGRGGWVMGFPTATGFQIDRWVGLTASGTFDTSDPSQNLHPSVTFGSYFWYPLAQGSNGWFYGISSQGSLLLASLSAFRLCVAGNQLWKAGGSDVEHAVYLQNCGSPGGVASPANWGATYNLGNYQAPVRDLIAANDQVFAGTPVGLFAGDQTGTFVNVLGELSSQVHPDNCRDLALFEGAVVVPHAAGVFGYHPSSGQVEDMTPPRADRSPVRGQVRALRSFGRYLYGGLYTGSQSWLLCAERQERGLAWHTLGRLPHVAKVSRLFVDGFTTASSGGKIPNRFWVATEGSIDPGGTAPVYFWPIPALDGNPLGASPGFSPNYCATARIDFGATDWGAPGTTKVYRSLEMVSENLMDAGGGGPSRAVSAYYTVDQGVRTLLGVFSWSPKQTLYFPAGEGSFITGQSIAISLESNIYSPLGPGVNSCSPVIKSVILRGSLMPRYTEEVTAVVRIADEMTDWSGTPMRSAATQLSELKTLANSDQPHQLVDLAGATSWVKVLGPPQEQEMYPDNQDSPPEIAATIRMVGLTFSAAPAWGGEGGIL